jgi:FkbM family methyltransferase
MQIIPRMPMIRRVRDRLFHDVEREIVWRYRNAMRTERVEVEGVTLLATSPLISDKIRRRIYQGAYERWELELVSRRLAAFDRVLELGAGIGAVSALCARRIGSDRVVCVEANAALEPLIRANHAANGVSPRLRIGLVASASGEGTLYVDENVTGSSTTKRNGSHEGVPVPALGLADLVAEHAPTFLIVDIEGEERDLFDSTELPGIEKICIELHPHIIGNRAAWKVLERLGELGFEMMIDDVRPRNFYLERPPAAMTDAITH